MLYNTIVEKDESGLNMLIAAVEQFSRERFLEGIRLKHYNLYDINQMVVWIREQQQKLNRESLALSRFAETFIQEYATDNNECFETARLFFNRIRSTIGMTKKVYKRMCPKVRRQLPSGTENLSVFERSYLTYAPCTPDVFGIDSFSDAVGELYHELETFFVMTVQTLALCHKMIRTEHAVRLDEERCLAIYKDSCDKAMSGLRDFTQMFCSSLPEAESELLERRSKAKKLADFALENYHRFNKTEFNAYLVLDTIRKGQHDGLTEMEACLWPNDHDRALRVREVVARFDELKDVEGQKGKLCSSILVKFLKWCGVEAEKEKKVYVEYFGKEYCGAFKLLSWKSVSQERKNLKDLGIDDEELIRDFEKAVGALGNLPLTDAIPFKHASGFS